MEARHANDDDVPIDDPADGISIDDPDDPEEQRHRSILDIRRIIELWNAFTWLAVCGALCCFLASLARPFTPISTRGADGTGEMATAAVGAAVAVVACVCAIHGRRRWQWKWLASGLGLVVVHLVLFVTVVTK